MCYSVMSISSSMVPPTHIVPVFSQNLTANPEQLSFFLDKSKTINELRQIHGFIIHHGIESHPVLNFKLQRNYSSLGHIKDSVNLFNRTLNRNVFFYTSIIRCHAINALHEQALLFYVRMLCEDVEPNEFTLSTTLKACNLEVGKTLHCHAFKFGHESDTYVRTALIDLYSKSLDIVSARLLFDRMLEKNLVSLTAMMTGYARNGDIDEARMMFDRMEEKDVVSWNVMINGYTQHGKPNEALILFRQMLESKVNPNGSSMVAVISACGQAGAFESGQWVHSYLRSDRTFVNDQVKTALIDMYSKCGNLEEARKVFDEMKCRDVVAYNAMIGGYAIHGFSLDSLKLFEEMTDKRIHPTDITFINVLNACAHAGLVSEGWSIFHSMTSEYKILPKIEHYGCMVNLLGRAGQLEEAHELVKTACIEVDPVLWGTLLGACRLHKNVSFGEKIVEFLHENALANSGTYVLLANIYAATGNWDRMARIRATMKQIGVQKEPGCSSIEVNSHIHEFRAGDVSHPKSSEIYEMLEKINVWLKENGHIPQTNEALHNIGETDREHSLEVHSERLALSFGLITTNPGTTIKIFKNLRVCQDCHAVIKLVSRIFGRKIVVRDRNRFHHFADGLCSCGDFW